MTSRVLLIQPPGICDSHFPPLGLAYIAAVLEKEGHQVQIIDAAVGKISYKRLGEKILKIKPDVVGLTLLTPYHRTVKQTIGVVKDVWPDAKIIVGGAHITALPAETLAEIPAIDIAVLGEGEYTMRDLITTLETGGDLRQVAGLAFRRGNDFILTTPRPLITNLDEVPFPARHLLPIYKYSGDVCVKRKPMTSVIATRGCPYNCIFCYKGIFGRTYRTRSPSNVIAEIKYLMKNYHFKEFNFPDDTLTVNRKWTLKLCQKIMESRLDISWKCSARVDNVDNKLLAMMKRAGCHTICYGIESGNQKILDFMKKGFTLDQVRKAVELTKKAGINIHTFFILGMPGENVNTARATIRFALELNPDIAEFFLATPMPGSELYHLALSAGMSVKHWEDFEYSRKTPFQLSTIPIQKLYSLRKYAYIRHLFRWRYIWENILLKTCQMQSSEDLRYIVRKIYFHSLHPLSKLLRAIEK